jgi:L-lactate utilization protein LutB
MPVFLKLLARSSTGQAMGVYTTLISGPRRPDDVDGPQELHVVLLDNGRSGILAGPMAEVLRCIRCGACLNACPVYRNVGGHAYNSVYPGPIGSLVSPLLYGHQYDELPRASSLCGLCHARLPGGDRHSKAAGATARRVTRTPVVGQAHRDTRLGVGHAPSMDVSTRPAAHATLPSG